MRLLGMLLANSANLFRKMVEATDISRRRSPGLPPFQLIEEKKWRAIAVSNLLGIYDRLS